MNGSVSARPDTLVTVKQAAVPDTATSTHSLVGAITNRKLVLSLVQNIPCLSQDMSTESRKLRSQRPEAFCTFQLNAESLSNVSKMYMCIKLVIKYPAFEACRK